MSFIDTAFSSKTDNWATPQALFDQLHAEFKFERDVCADDMNAKCPRYWTQIDDALKQKWTGVLFMNPPYGRVIGEWIKKAYEAARDNKATVVCLLPSRTDTRWFHDYCTQGEIRFLKGRIKFGNGTSAAPFPSMIVIFRPIDM